MHKDPAYFGLEPHQLVTVWLAITEVSEEMGYMKVIPKSHLGPSKAHEETFFDKNLLARGVDVFSHWDKDPTPKSQIDIDMITHIENAGGRYVDVKYRQETERR